MKKNYNNYFEIDTKTLTFNLLSYLLRILLMSVGIALLGNYIVQIFFENYNIETVNAFVEIRTRLFLFNAVIIFIIQIWFTSLLGNILVSSLMTLLLSVLFGFTNGQKALFRSEPLFPSDLLMVKDLPFMINSLEESSAKLLFSLLISILVLLIVVIVGIKKWRKSHPIKFKQSKRAVRLLLFVFSSIGLIQLLSFHNPGNPFKEGFVEVGYAEWQPHSQIYNAQRNGPIAAFLYTMSGDVVAKPEDYSQEYIKRIVDKYNGRADETNLTRPESMEDINIIYVMSESFSDPMKIKELEVENDPIPFTRSMMEDYSGGSILSQGYGGGTANIEFEALTGLSLETMLPGMTTPYTQLASKMNKIPTMLSFLPEDYYYKTAIHPHHTQMYRRTEVYENMGFDEFLYNETMAHTDKIENNPFISDGAAYQEVIEQMEKTDKTDFIHLVTMQNHGPYSGFYSEIKNSVSGDTDLAEVSGYIQGLTYSDQAMEEWIAKLEQFPEKIVVLFWGDHLPSSYGDTIINKNSLVTKYETPLFIYSNYTEVQKDLGIISPVFFMNEIFEATNSKISGYHSLLGALQEQLPAFEKGIYVDGQKNEVVQTRAELPTETQEILYEYEAIMYDITSGMNYSKQLGFY
ncbi:LTA synthase family protein [Carnobacterium antarcticum]|uniref:LTA synthase family protein n=1 Tax=Carnobacterium antarcticum TaxID=2126436 RepID=A0ABW4NLA8_9LACT|nr:LTA synthase family protein [Carnobacterium sp. CP1]ALV21565.1 Cyclic beta-1,2-glucan modification transmembrane protein [Carnobacterium sp. CP1]